MPLPCNGTFKFSAVRAYHVYIKDMSPFIGDTFVSEHEKSNAHDRYAMTIIPDDGHLPKHISKICCLFVLRGGTIVGK